MFYTELYNTNLFTAGSLVVRSFVHEVFGQVKRRLYQIGFKQ